ncbi:hypothetical protein H4R18_005218 [Coemansia javaensis]|uniref:non-specific serine/threonine protein kinase n=1 Tax=Coemansia javaensis TaxID=2761396 RepID=A0A9W8H2M7_9FUNG|nr:hypothetical protein H4R18_005218 [Coemansia javaensis]
MWRGAQCFTVRQVMSEGASGKLQVVEHNETRQRYALRRVGKVQCIRSGQAAAVVAGRELLEELDHPFVEGLRFSFQDTHAVYMATDLMEGGSLARQLRMRQRFGEAIVRFWAAELACALQHLHSEHRIAHGRVCTRNILVDGTGHAVLTGLQRRAPDADCAGDWRALGAVMYECLYGRPPFRSGGGSGSGSGSSRSGASDCGDSPSSSAQSLPVAAAWGDCDDPVFPVTTDSRISMDCISAIRGLLHRDPAQRLGAGRRGFARLKRHPFFATFDWSLLEDRGLVPPFVPDDVYAGDAGAAAAGGFEELGECIDLQPPPLEPDPELADLEARFADFDYGEYQRFKAYIERHGAIDELVADAIRRAGRRPEPRDVAAHAAVSDTPLEFLTLGGLPVVRAGSALCPAAGPSPGRRDSVAALAMSQASLASLAARPATRALRTGGQLVRRTTSTALARFKGRTRTAALRRKGTESVAELAPQSQPQSPAPAPAPDPAPAPAPEPPQLVRPPSAVPVDVVTWTEMTAGQRALAQRYCAKMARENQRLMAALVDAPDSDDGSVDDALLQSAYSLTAASLLPAARDASVGRAASAGHVPVRGRAVAATLAIARPESRSPAAAAAAPRLLAGGRARLAADPDPDPDPGPARPAAAAAKEAERPGTAAQRGGGGGDAGARPATRGLHTKPAGAVPRLQPIADGWRRHAAGGGQDKQSRGQGAAPPTAGAPVRAPALRQMSSDGWDLLPETADRAELRAETAAAAAAASA